MQIFLLNAQKNSHQMILLQKLQRRVPLVSYKQVANENEKGVADIDVRTCTDVSESGVLKEGHNTRTSR